MKKIVIKLGTSSLVNANKKLSPRHMIEIARQIAHLHQKGYQIVLVSSGAIAAGRESLSISSATSSIPHKQMFASIGQVLLMQMWNKLFSIYDVSIGQVLLTQENVSNKKNRENAQNTLLNLLAHQTIPIVNENDTVATEEIQFGDNDNLSALVANLIRADLLILLTDQEGLLTADPHFHPEAKLIETIDQIDETIVRSARSSSPGSLGTGGMLTKIEAARLAVERGTTTIIASSKKPGILSDLVAGKKIGTFFPGKLT